MRFTPVRVSLIDDMFKDAFYRRPNPAMKTNISEKDGSYLFDIELPGFAKEDIKVELENGYLTVNAEKNENQEDKDEQGNLIRQERFSGKYVRSYYIGEEYNDQDISATYQDGELKLSLAAKTVEEIANKKTIAIA